MTTQGPARGQNEADMNQGAAAGGAEAYLREVVGLAVARRVSDLHLKMGAPPYWRLLGELEQIPDQPALSKADMEEIEK